MKQILQIKWLTITMLSIIGISLLLGMISQLSHTVIVYQRLLPDELSIFAIFFSISFDLFVGVSIMIGWKICAGASALIMALINDLCYNKFNFDTFEHTVISLSAILLSCIQPIIIFAYSYIIHEMQATKTKLNAIIGPDIKEAKNEISALKEMVEKLLARKTPGRKAKIKELPTMNVKIN